MPPSTTVYDKHVLPAGRQVRVWTLIVKLWSGHFLSLLFVQENMKRETTKISVVRIRKRWNLNKTIYDILPEHMCIYMWKNKSSSQHWCCTYIKVWLMSNKWSLFCQPAYTWDTKICDFEILLLMFFLPSFQFIHNLWSVSFLLWQCIVCVLHFMSELQNKQHKTLYRDIQNM